MPDHWFFLPVKDSSVPVASYFGLMETTSESAPLNGPMTLSSWLSAADDDASGFWFQSLLGDLAFPGVGRLGRLRRRGDDRRRGERDVLLLRRARGHFELGYAATAFIWGGGQLADAWPGAPDDDEYAVVRPSNVETLLISGELDFATPPQAATEELLPTLPNGHQVVLPGFGHSTSIWTEQPEAGTRLINTFLATGRVDDSLYEPQPVDFTPEVTQAALGKGIAGAMVGLAALTVLSILWMAFRRKPRFGRKTSPILRSLYPIVLGLGRVVRRRPARDHDDARYPARRPVARDDLRRLADRPRHLLRVGGPRLAGGRKATGFAVAVAAALGGRLARVFFKE